MERIEGFRTLDEVRLHRARLRAQRDLHRGSMEGHWRTLGEGSFHRGVVNGAVRGLWNAWQPLDTFRTVVGNGSDVGSVLLGMVLGSKARTPWGRMLVWAASAAMPMVLERLQGNERVQHILNELRTTWTRVRERMRTPS
jgi:hypothetical protein